MPSNGFRFWLSLFTLAIAPGTAPAYVRFEYNLPPYNPSKIDVAGPGGTFNILGERRFLLVENAGAVSVWRTDEYSRGAERLLTIYTRAVDARFSSSGDRIYVLGNDGCLKEFDLDGSVVRKSSQCQPATPAILAVSRVRVDTLPTPNLDGLAGSSAERHLPREVIAVGDSQGQVTFWSDDLRRLAGPIQAHGGAITSLAFLDGEHVVSGGSDGKVSNTATNGHLIAQWAAATGPDTERLAIKGVSVGPDGMIASSSNSQICVWRTPGTPLWCRPTPEPAFAGQILFGPGYQMYASDGRVIYRWSWRPETGSAGKLAVESHPVFTDDTGPILAFAGIGSDVTILTDHYIHFLDIDPTPGYPQRAEVMTVRSNFYRNTALVSRDGAYVVTDGEYWRTAPVLQRYPLPEGATKPRAIGAHYLLTVSTDVSNLKSAVWNMESDPPRELIRRPCWDAALSEDGTTFACAAPNKVEIYSFSGRAYQLSGTIATALSESLWIKLSPSGKVLVGLLFDSSNHGSVLVWRIDHPLEHPVRFTPSLGKIDFWSSAAVAQSEDMLALGLTGGAVCLFDLANEPNERWCSIGHRPDPGGIYAPAVAFGPDSAHFLSAADDGALNYWSVDRANRETRAIGLPIQNIGFLSSRIYAVLNSDDILFLKQDLSTAGRLLTAPGGVIVLAGNQSFWAQGSLVDKVGVYGTKGKVTSPLERDRLLDERGAVGYASGYSTIGERISAQLRDLWFAYVGLSPAIKAVVNGGLLFATVVVFWLLCPALFAAWAMQSVTSPGPAPFSWLRRYLLLAQWLGGTTRSLDAWLLRNRLALTEQCFAERQSVRSRTNYAEVFRFEATTEWLKDIQNTRRAALWINGPGGSGKSALAFELTRRALARREPLIPVLIERDWSAPGGEGLYNEVSSALTAGGRSPTVSMVRKMAYLGRILLVVDSLSEFRSESAAQAVLEVSMPNRTRHVMITARSPSAHSDVFDEVSLEPLNAEWQLREFAGAYIGRDQIEDSVCELKRLLDLGPVSPMLAWLQLQSILRRDGLHDSAAVMSYPELVNEYVLSLRPRGERALSIPDFLRAARTLAFACVEERLAPTYADYEYLRGSLANAAQQAAFFDQARPARELSPGEILSQLVESGLLRSQHALASSRLWFWYDPVAEYLAAMHLFLGGQEALARIRQRAPVLNPGFSEILEQVSASAKRANASAK